VTPGLEHYDVVTRQRSEPPRGLVVALISVILVGGFTSRTVRATPPVCAGDCDFDNFLDGDDASLLIAAIYGDSACAAADVNADSSISAADVTDLVDRLATAACGPPTTPVASRTPTVTATINPTAVATPVSTWIRLAPIAGGKRQEHAVAALGGKIYVIGGFVTATGQQVALITDTVEAYDIGSNTWETVAPLPLEIHHTVAAVVGDRLYAIGGLQTAGFTPIRNVYQYDPGQNVWTRRADLPTARGAMAAGVINGLVYVVGGCTGPFCGTSITLHEVYNPTTNTWMALAPLPSPRNHLAASVIDDKLYVVGGRTAGNTNELDRYDPMTNQWEVLPPMPTARGGLVASVLNGRLVVAGGEMPGVFDEVEIFDPTTEEWISLAPMARPRHGMGAVTVGDLMYVPGGGIVAGFGATDYNDALRLTP
jgi:N-acetylneuraminic acid mutarotase